MMDSQPTAKTDSTSSCPPGCCQDNCWFKPAAIIIGILIMIGLFSNIYLLLRKDSQKLISKIAPAPTQTTLLPTTTIDPTANWKTYNSPFFPFTVKYPSNMSPAIGGGLALQLRGSKEPQGPHSGLYDGIDLGFNILEFNTGSLKEYVQQQTENDKKINAEIVKDTSEIKMGDLYGYTYTRSLEGITQIIFLQSPLEADKFVKIGVDVADPTGQGYQRTVDQILSTFKFLP